MSAASSIGSLPNVLRYAAAGIGLYLAGNLVYHEFTKYQLRNKIVLITGGSRGLGLVLARALAAKGAKLAICARSEDQLKIAAMELELRGAKVLPLKVDVTSREQVSAMINDVIAHYGSLDVLINNAGIVQVGPADAMGIEDYEQAMQTNFWAPLYAITAALPHFMAKGGGRIVNITSIGGKIAIPHLLPYTASKFAITGLSEGLHAELKKHNIQVTTIVPNLMRTGGPRNADIKGAHEAEYAWFKLSDSSPLFSQRAEVAAKTIIRAVEYGKAEAILSLTAKIANVAKGIAPAWIDAVLTIANKLLPDNVEGGHVTKKGYEAESPRSQGRVAAFTDRAAVQNNQL